MRVMGSGRLAAREGTCAVPERGASARTTAGPGPWAGAAVIRLLASSSWPRLAFSFASLLPRLVCAMPARCLRDACAMPVLVLVPEPDGIDECSLLFSGSKARLALAFSAQLELYSSSGGSQVTVVVV